MSSTTVRSVSFAFLCLALRSLVGAVSAAPTYVSGQTGHAPPLADLFDRVIRHSARMHSIASELRAEFVQYFLPSKHHISRVKRSCHTSSILTPNGKEKARRLAGEELTEVILKLLWSWRDPLWRFHQRMAHHDDFNSFSSNKALEMSDMVHKLHKGIEKVAEKLQNLGIISNSDGSLAAPHELLLPSPDGPHWILMNDYDLLYCLRRDSNKVQNYLKVLKCRIVPDNAC